MYNVLIAKFKDPLPIDTAIKTNFFTASFWEWKATRSKKNLQQLLREVVGSKLQDQFSDHTHHPYFSPSVNQNIIDPTGQRYFI